MVTREKKGERVLPVAAMVLALALLVVLLPTVLRPPPQNATGSAEFSPDAPPDENQESIIAALNRGSTGTAGDGAGAGGGDEAVVGAQAPDVTVPPVPTKARACPRGAGNPPRQTESLYSAPCAAAFIGDNGGATYKGVTANEVRVSLAPCTAGIYTTYNGKQEDDPPASGETTIEKTYRIFQRYFNANYQFYGRHLTFYHDRPDNCFDPPTTRASAVKADTDYQSFGYNTAQRDGIHEGIRRKMVVGGVYGPTAQYFQDNQPYVWGWQPDSTQTVRLLSEFICKQLAGKPANYTDDPTINGQTRKFGLFWSSQFFLGVSDEMFQAALKQQCGESYARIISYSIYAGEGAENLGGATVRMRADGVTTIVCFCDYLAPSFVTNSATQEGYFPEWVMPGTGEMDLNSYAALFTNTEQWRHAFGFSALEMPMQLGQYDFYRAYHSVDPESDPDNNVGRLMFHVMLQWANGIQMAGPNLTPETFMQGLQKLPRRPPSPAWAAAGGFGPGDYTYSDYISFAWWDPNTPPPEAPSNAGAYRFVNNGQRYRLGEIPTTQLPFFKEGIAGAPTD